MAFSKAEPDRMRGQASEGEACPLCGAVPPPGVESCRAMIYSVWEREYSGPEFAAVHLLTVDGYALQHGEYFGARSNAFHLMRLCWLIELGGTERGGSSRLHRRKFEEAYRSFPNLAPPEDRGALTVAHVCGLEDPGERARKVKEWASVVWEAWAEHRGWAREQTQRLFVA